MNKKINVSLPKGIISRVACSKDGGIWFNHTVGLLKIIKGNVITILSYLNREYQPLYAPPINRHKHSPSDLTAPIVVLNRVFVCCSDFELSHKWVLCFSDKGDLLWKTEIAWSCTELFLISNCIFALCNEELQMIEMNGILSKKIPILSGKIIAYSFTEKSAFFLMCKNYVIKLVQMDDCFRFEEKYLFNEDPAEFYVDNAYPEIILAASKLYVIFPTIRDGFTGMIKYRFNIDKSECVSFEEKEEIGTFSAKSYSTVMTAAAMNRGFIFFDLYCSGEGELSRLWMIETTSHNCNLIIPLPPAVREVLDHPPIIVGQDIFFACTSLENSCVIGHYHNEKFEFKKDSKFDYWFLYGTKIIICKYGHKACKFFEIYDFD